MKWKKGAPYGVLKTAVVDEAGNGVATVWTHKPGQERGETVPWPEGEANLNLVVAAPEVTEALERIVNRENELTHKDQYDHFCRFCGAGDWLTKTVTHDNGCPFQQARAAIAKARGKS